VRCSWLEEPGEYRWIFRRDEETVTLRILEFPGSHPARPDEAGTVVFETSQAVDRLAQAIALGASRTLEKHGDVGYEGQWRTAPFPVGLLRLINARFG
jgi:hypothetical protein